MSQEAPNETPRETQDFESNETLFLTEQEVIAVLDSTEAWSEGAKEIATRYTDQCNKEADLEAANHPGDATVSNRANIPAMINIAKVFLKSNNYREYGLEALMDAFDAAEQSPDTYDLAEEINVLGNEYEAKG